MQSGRGLDGRLFRSKVNHRENKNRDESPCADLVQERSMTNGTVVKGISLMKKNSFRKDGNKQKMPTTLTLTDKKMNGGRRNQLESSKNNGSPVISATSPSCLITSFWWQGGGYHLSTRKAVGEEQRLTGAFQIRETIRVPCPLQEGFEREGSYALWGMKGGE